MSAQNQEHEQEMGWRCDCDCFNKWTDYADMEEYNKEEELECAVCEKYRPPCYERGAKGLGHPYYDMPFKSCEGCVKYFDIRTDKYVVDEEDEMYCSMGCLQNKEEKLTCPHCGRDEEECEKNTESEINPITHWIGWGVSCDDCYYENHPDSDDEEE
jgi:hypothetical protein